MPYLSYLPVFPNPANISPLFFYTSSLEGKAVYENLLERYIQKHHRPKSEAAPHCPGAFPGRSRRQDPAPRHAIQLFTGNAFDLQQAVRVMVQHVECPCPEPFHDQRRRIRQAGAPCRELGAFSFIAGILCRFRHIRALRVVHEDAEPVLLVMEYLDL